MFRYLYTIVTYSQNLPKKIFKYATAKRCIQLDWGKEGAKALPAFSVTGDNFSPHENFKQRNQDRIWGEGRGPGHGPPQNYGPHRNGIF